jgi:hypothetical protein
MPIGGGEPDQADPVAMKPAEAVKASATQTKRGAIKKPFHT